MVGMTCLESLGEPVSAAVWYCLNNYRYEDAVFLAERLHAEVSSLDTLFLLATCYYRSGRVQQAKYHLSKEGALSHPQCSLLYAQCCLSLKEYKSGLAALQGLLCQTERSESNLVNYYGDDVGVVLYLLGVLNLRLNQTKEAIKQFKTALKYNPFLWSAFEKLCDLGESVSASECFSMNTLPSFLLRSNNGSRHTSDHVPISYPLTTTTNTHNSPIDSIHLKSTFTPVDPTPKPGYVTPDLFGQPSLGKAIASSTPASVRAISFSHEPIPFKLGHDTVSAKKNHIYSSLDVPTDPKLLANGKYTSFTVSRESGLSVIKGALDFGSATSGSNRVLPRVSYIMPLTPSFGVPMATPSTDSKFTETTSVQHALDFDSVTPSTADLPTDHFKTITSAPRPTKGKKSLQLPEHDGQQVFPEQMGSTAYPDNQVSEFTHPLMQTNTIESKSSASTITSTAHITPPRTQVTPAGSAFRVPSAPKSTVNIRRSARLAAGKRDVHTARGKSKAKINLNRKSLDPTAKKVTFSSPSLIASASRDDRQPPSSKAARLANRFQSPANQTTSHQTAPTELIFQDENVCESVKSVKTGRSSIEILAQRQSELEAVAMAGLTSLMQLLQKMGFAYQSLMSYNLTQAIEELQTIAPHHSNTPWVFSQIARAYFVGERFKQSAKLYAKVHQMDPHRQEGMELYTSALWHLHKDVELSVVAEALHSSNKTSPQALCAMASVMSKYRDHGSAIKYLQRAIQVCPQFEYAHTLLGLEWCIVKDFDKALSAFQEAVTINPRHSNAWYGLSHVYYTQEKYSFAETYASKALTINKCSSVACTQMALAQFQCKHYTEALCSLNRAIAINSNNPIPKFHRAKVLELLDRWEEALEQLNQLTAIWPKEPNLYVAKGKILQKLNRIPEAILSFSWACDFGKTEAGSQIREEIDQAYHGQTEGQHDNELDSFFLDEDVDMDSGDSIQD